MENKAAEGVKHFEGLLKEKPFMKSKFQPFINRLKMIRDKGVPGVTTAPFSSLLLKFAEFLQLNKNRWLMYLRICGLKPRL